MDEPSAAPRSNRPADRGVSPVARSSSHCQGALQSHISMRPESGAEVWLWFYIENRQVAEMVPAPTAR
jgi:hypothetical protein